MMNLYLPHSVDIAACEKACVGGGGGGGGLGPKPSALSKSLEDLQQAGSKKVREGWFLSFLVRALCVGGI